MAIFLQDLGSDTTYRTVLRCSKTEENEESESNCEAEVQGHTSNPASLEVAAIADTDDDFLIDSLVNEQKFINFELCITIFIAFFLFFRSHLFHSFCLIQCRKNLYLKDCYGWAKYYLLCLSHYSNVRGIVYVFDRSLPPPG